VRSNFSIDASEPCFEPSIDSILPMPRLYLVRHAKPAATWSEAADPGLDPTGVSQAAAAADELNARLSRPVHIYTSPMQRCRHTAAPLENLWQRPAEVMLPVAEIPAPPLSLEHRHVWLQRAMAGTWPQLQEHSPSGGPDHLAWRSALLQRIAAVPEDSVVFSHYIAINVVVGAALGSDDMICFRPDHASITIIDTAGSSVRIVELGKQAETLVLTRP
jgi:broad specificity phosphatase PhoE